MAVDSAEKRRSVAGIQWTLIPSVTNNAAQDQEWRQEAGWSYSGILAGGAAAATPNTVGARVLSPMDDAGNYIVPGIWQPAT